jgi:hypothetical protein
VLAEFGVLEADARLGRHEVLADEQQLRDDAQDVEVHAECEEEAVVSATKTTTHSQSRMTSSKGGVHAHIVSTAAVSYTTRM